MLQINYTSPGPIASAFIRERASMSLLLGPIGCLSADHMYMTRCGWRFMSEYTIGEEILVADPVTGRTWFEVPERYIDEPCDTFYHLHSRGVDQVLSAEHRVPFFKKFNPEKLRVSTAEQIYLDDNRLRSGWDGMIPCGFTAPENAAGVHISDENLRVMVMICADGCFPKKASGAYCVIVVRKQRKLLRARDLLTAAGIEYTEGVSIRDGKEEYRIIFHAPYVFKSLTAFWGASSAQLAIIADEALNWDGMRDAGYSDWRYFTTLPEDAAFMEYVFSAQNRRTSISVSDELARGWSRHYTVTAVKNPRAGIRGSTNADCGVHKIYVEGGRKYCFTTSSGFFVTKRNDCVAVTGNSGKSAACVIKILTLCIKQHKGPDGMRRSRWAVVRNTKEQLKDTTLRTWLDWLPPNSSLTVSDGWGQWKEVERTFYLEFDDVRAEILFRALDKPEDVSKLLSLELTGAWFNECREIDVVLFNRAYERCGRYPSVRNGGSAWSGIIADTNAPVMGSDWYKVIEGLPLVDDQPNSVVPVVSYKQPSGMSAGAENLPNLTPGYYQDKARGKTQDEIDVYIHGIYGVSDYLKPVFARQFKHKHHVSTTPLKVIPGAPVIVGIDPGLSFGAALFQVDWAGRIFLLREIASFDEGLTTVCERKLLPLLRNTFPGCPVITVIDPAGFNRSSNDEKRATDILRSHKLRCRPADNNDPNSRVQALRQLLDGWTPDGPKILIDPSCKMLISGFMVNYVFQKHRSGQFSPTPSKNEYSHVMDAAGYAAMYLTHGFRYEDATAIDEYRAAVNSQQQSQPMDSYTGY